MQGILLVDKPADWTSFDVVNYVRRIVANVEGKKPKNCKVGHSGTLDPFATGLLILLIGKEYTRRASEFSKLDKTYEMTMRLGQTSTTGDPEGELSDVANTVPTEAEIVTALEQFRGEIQQIPPAFSAIKVNGVRAYKLARDGKEVIMEARPVTIHRLELLDYTYPEVKLVADVSSGTYIRTLVEDLGVVLKTGAYTTELRRTKIATNSVEQAVAVKSLDVDSLAVALTS
ncbi:MAG: tRNA pseudouridine(55) synthase TruB [Patescibacteria group bacterium]|nr:tRNA pseudouridine(55) synthase TruB [Patescibacteria group bacterium]